MTLPLCDCGADASRLRRRDVNGCMAMHVTTRRPPFCFYLLTIIIYIKDFNNDSIIISSRFDQIGKVISKYASSYRVSMHPLYYW